MYLQVPRRLDGVGHRLDDLLALLQPRQPRQVLGHSPAQTFNHAVVLMLLLLFLFLVSSPYETVPRFIGVVGIDPFPFLVANHEMSQKQACVNGQAGYSCSSHRLL